MIEILNRYTNAVLYRSETATTVAEAVKQAIDSRADLAGANLAGANLAGADLAGADLAGAYLAHANLAGAYLAHANLAGANLAGANLAGANLARADLARADLAGADLAGANLAGANLARAKGVHSNRVTPLRILLAQTGTLRAWKLVNKDGEGPYAKQNGYTPICYEVGKEYKAVADADESKDCAAGISLATLAWVMREWRDGYRVLLVEFDRKDLACIPNGIDGKFRVHRCRVIEECDLKEIGLVEETTPVEAKP